MASCLNRSAHNPKFVASPDRVGPQTLAAPIIAVRMRVMVPLPDRGGPMSKRIFCWRVSQVSTYPNHSCKSPIDGSSSGQSSDRNFNQYSGFGARCLTS